MHALYPVLLLALQSRDSGGSKRSKPVSLQGLKIASRGIKECVKQGCKSKAKLCRCVQGPSRCWWLVSTLLSPFLPALSSPFHSGGYNFLTVCSRVICCVKQIGQRRTWKLLSSLRKQLSLLQSLVKLSVTQVGPEWDPIPLLPLLPILCFSHTGNISHLSCGKG